MMINSAGNSMNASRMAEMRDRMFSRIDTDGDEKISKEEFETFQANAPDGGKRADEIFAKIDTNGDGSIGKEEHEDTMKKMAQEGRASRPPMGGPKGPPPSGGGGPKGAGVASGSGGSGSVSGSDESEDLNFNGIPDDEEDDSKTTLESVLKEILKKYAENGEAGKASSSRPDLSSQNLYA